MYPGESENSPPLPMAGEIGQKNKVFRDDTKRERQVQGNQKQSESQQVEFHLGSTYRLPVDEAEEVTLFRLACRIAHHSPLLPASRRANIRQISATLTNSGPTGPPPPPPKLIDCERL